MAAPAPQAGRWSLSTLKLLVSHDFTTADRTESHFQPSLFQSCR